MQVQHRAALLEAAPAAFARHRAAAGGQHDVAELGELVDQRFLAVAERLLALDLEDGRDRHAEPLLQLDVRVVEGKLQPARDLAAERGLAGAHEADEEEIAPV
jgi:hypothetical protein